MLIHNFFIVDLKTLGSEETNYQRKAFPLCVVVTLFAPIEQRTKEHSYSQAKALLRVNI